MGSWFGWSMRGNMITHSFGHNMDAPVSSWNLVNKHWKPFVVSVKKRVIRYAFVWALWPKVFMFMINLILP